MHVSTIRKIVSCLYVPALVIPEPPNDVLPVASAPSKLALPRFARRKSETNGAATHSRKKGQDTVDTKKYVCTHNRPKKHACTHKRPISGDAIDDRHTTDPYGVALLRQRSRPVGGHCEATTRAVECQGATTWPVGSQASDDKVVLLKSRPDLVMRGLLNVRQASTRLIRDPARPIGGPASNGETDSVMPRG
ncbi:hypothetical protein Acr_11g0011130 [Actinidia rufa]|uniref:Uncharacterized protein n=1 Tax=Actinidia rufa TaxID=165716 RepID=A0A7J0FFX3_9ERIC|nr:hypothetical protein Acr_11g0011130 [Actinidia rufa]